jgi:hypothetical protein
MTSAYPRPIEDLLPAARELANQLGRTPSRNRLMSEFNVGAGKASKVLAALTDTPADTTPDPDPVPGPDESSDLGPGSARLLHAVPDDEHDPAPVAHQNPTTEPAQPGTDPLSAVGLADHDTAVSVPVTTATDPDPDTRSAGPAWLARARAWRPARPVPGRAGTARPDPVRPSGSVRAVRGWPLLLLAAPAFIAIWSGWVGLGALTGFGPVHPLPGIVSGFTLNSAITLPIGVETYAAYALRVWLAGAGSDQARRFARVSAIGALVLGAAGQIAYHLMTAQHMTAAPWPITTAVASLPVVVLGFGAALAHLQHHRDETEHPR